MVPLYFLMAFWSGYSDSATSGFVAQISLEIDFGMRSPYPSSLNQHNEELGASLIVGHPIQQRTLYLGLCDLIVKLSAR